MTLRLKRELFVYSVMLEWGTWCKTQKQSTDTTLSLARLEYGIPQINYTFSHDNINKSQLSGV